MTNTFNDLADFITIRMRMSHIYQPAMLIALARSGGVATIDVITDKYNSHRHAPSRTSFRDGSRPSSGRSSKSS